MSKNFKKIIALILTVITVFGVTSVAVSAAAEKKVPVLYITGYGSELYADANSQKSEKIYPVSTDVGATIKEALAPCLTELAMGAFSGDYDKYCDTLYDVIAPIFDEIRLAPDATVKDGSGRNPIGYSNPLRLFPYLGFDHSFFYDWRLSPYSVIENSNDGNSLEETIDFLLKAKGADKVNIIGRCFGANVLSTYLAAMDEEALKKINKVSFFIPSTEGIGLIGAFFSGRIEINAEYLDDYVTELMKYIELVEDSTVKDFLDMMLAVMEQATLLDLGTEKLQALIDNIKENLFPRLIRATYGSFPSFWAMVPDEYFADAVEFIYNTDELKEEYAGTIELIERYNTEVQKPSRENILNIKDKIDVSIIAKYNLPAAPVFGESVPTSDAIAETKYASFGATCADYGTTLSEEYIANMSEDDKAYLSPDLKIDASTCVLPDKTWFIKNSYHDHFTDVYHNLIRAFFNGEDVTVTTYEEYPQFLDAHIDGEELVPATKDKDSVAKTESDKRVSLLFKFLNLIIEFFIKLFNK